eukprot:snap_masked-scaffold_13-processed-gene-10.31-mRNA-1 protein AED:1.00 eAED:1.00 QI:0/-1/0/0/-1/1/1/0/306
MDSRPKATRQQQKRVLRRRNRMPVHGVVNRSRTLSDQEHPTSNFSSVTSNEEGILEPSSPYRRRKKHRKGKSKHSKRHNDRSAERQIDDIKLVSTSSGFSNAHEKKISGGVLDAVLQPTANAFVVQQDSPMIPKPHKSPKNHKKSSPPKKESDKSPNAMNAPPFSPRVAQKLPPKLPPPRLQSPPLPRRAQPPPPAPKPLDVLQNSDSEDESDAEFVDVSKQDDERDTIHMIPFPAVRSTVQSFEERRSLNGQLLDYMEKDTAKQQVVNGLPAPKFPHEARSVNLKPFKKKPVRKRSALFGKFFRN